MHNKSRYFPHIQLHDGVPQALSTMGMWVGSERGVPPDLRGPGRHSRRLTSAGIRSDVILWDRRSVVGYRSLLILTIQARFKLGSHVTCQLSTE